MSDFIAEASVLIRPDTTAFRTQLEAQLATIVATTRVPPVSVAPVTAGGAAASTATLVASQETLETSSTHLLNIENLLTNIYEEQILAASGLSGATKALTVAQNQEASSAGIAAAQQDALASRTRRTTADITGLASATGRLDAALLGLRTAIGSSAVIGLGAGALAAIAFGKALRTSSDLAADFETQMNLLAATTGASTDEISAAAEASRQLGEDVTLPAVSAGDAAQAITELSKAGLDLQDSISGARGVLELATAAQIDNAAATELAANALNAFGLAGDQATHVADLLAGASIAAQGSVEDMGIALQQSAAAAAQVGVSLDDTVALLTLLAQGGLRASDAGTSFRVALLRLAAPTAEAQAILKQLNIQVRDLEGNIRPEVFSEFAQATADLSPELRDAAAAAVFGQDAFRAFSLIARQGAEGLDEAREATNRAGAAATLAGAQTEGFRGSINALKSAAETAAIGIGGVLNPAIASIADAATVAIGGISDLIEKLNELDRALPGEDVADRITGFIFQGPAETIERGTRLFVAAGDAITTTTDEVREKLKGLREDLNLALATGQTEKAAELARQIGLVERELRTRTGEPGLALSTGALATSTAESLRIADQFGERFNDQLDAIGRDAETGGEEIGKNVGKGVKKGLDESLVEAINSAKQNLLSLGADLASQIGQAIDAGPLGQELERLQASLQIRQATRQRFALLDDLKQAQNELKIAQVDAGALGQALRKLQAQLDELRRTDTQAGARETLRAAQAELRDAREAIQGLGPGDTARQRRDIQDFLAPLVEQVRSAKSGLQQARLEERIAKVNDAIEKRKELFTEDEVTTARRRVAAIQQAIRDFDDQAIIKNLQETIAAQKQAVQEGIANLIAQFEAGQINFAQFAARLARLTGPYRTAGKALGIAFAAGFQAQIDAVIEQAKQAAIGFALPGGAATRGSPTPSVVSIQDALKAAQEATAKNTGPDGAIVTEIKKLPERIAEALRRQQGAPSKPTAGAAPTPTPRPR